MKPLAPYARHCSSAPYEKQGELGEERGLGRRQGPMGNISFWHFYKGLKNTGGAKVGLQLWIHETQSLFLY